jgi:DNA modification methylase
VSLYYEADGIRLYHGDCREIDAWLTADVLLTDPPYGVAYATGGRRRNAAGVITAAREAVPVAGDESPALRDEALQLWGDRPALVFGSWRIPRPLGTQQRLVWFKRNTNPGLGTGTPWSPADEEIYVLGDGFTGRRSVNVYITDESRASAGGLAARIGHPTPKPVGLIEQLLTKCPPGIIADPFAGSGSTLLAARAQGRRAVGVEIEERYCEIIARRLAQGDLFACDGDAS